MPSIAIVIGIITLMTRRKSDALQKFLGYAAILLGLGILMYSSKAILLSMYQKFIQDEVNI